jgi:hypothetical protein
MQQSLQTGPDDFEDARSAVALAFSARPSEASATRIAAWAAQGLAPVCADADLSRAAIRFDALDQACAAMQATGAATDMRWVWGSAAMAKGWAAGLGVAARVALASAGMAASIDFAQARSGVAREASRQGLFALLAHDDESFEQAHGAFQAWVRSLIEQAGEFSHLIAAQAMLGLREALHESVVEQGADETDIKRARAVGATLCGHLSASQRAMARREYVDSIPFKAIAFEKEFLP